MFDTFTDTCSDCLESLLSKQDQLCLTATDKIFTLSSPCTPPPFWTANPPDRKIESVCGCSCNPTAISLKAGCELFLRYTTRTSAIENEDFATAKARIIEVGLLETQAHSLNVYMFGHQQ